MEFMPCKCFIILYLDIISLFLSPTCLFHFKSLDFNIYDSYSHNIYILKKRDYIFELFKILKY